MLGQVLFCLLDALGLSLDDALCFFDVFSELRSRLVNLSDVCAQRLAHFPELFPKLGGGLRDEGRQSVLSVVMFKVGVKGLLYSSFLFRFRHRGCAWV